MDHRAAPVAILGVALMAASCTSPGTPAASSPAPAPAAEAPSAAPRLVKGMTADEVRAQLGKPEEKSLVTTKEGMAEIWTYHRSFTRTNQVATATKSTPTFAGVSGDAQGMGTVQTPVYSLEHFEVTQTIKLLMFQGRLLEWKTAAADKRTFD